MKEIIEKYVGKKATIFVGGLSVEVNILDAKNSYGRDRFLVSPVAGSKQVWVEFVNLIN